MSGLILGCRRFAAQTWRVTKDHLVDRDHSFVVPDSSAQSIGTAFPVQFSLTQQIRNTDHVEAKRHNISMACRALENLPILPGKLFSFWRLVGRPTAARGFLPGRSLLGKELRLDSGGGLCQLSGLLYHLALTAGLRIVERHAHSVDIYDNSIRYTPLGADATVAYGFKDLRFENPLLAAICFRLTIQDNEVTGSLCSFRPIAPCQVEFRIIANFRNTKTVETWRRSRNGDSWKKETLSRYQCIPPNTLFSRGSGATDGSRSPQFSID